MAHCVLRNYLPGHLLATLPIPDELRLWHIQPECQTINALQSNIVTYPAVVKCAGDSTVYGYLIQLETQSQRTKLDNFEGETYIPVSVSASLLNADGEPNGQIMDADMYVWDGEDSALSYEPWSLDYFIEERLDDWLDLFEGVELVGEDE